MRKTTKMLLPLLTVLLLCYGSLASANHNVRVTAYSVVSTHSDVASSEIRLGPKHHKRVISLSWDLAKKYEYGDKFILELSDGERIEVEYQDKMHKKWRNRVDVFLLHSQCKKWGNKKGVLIPLTAKERGKNESIKIGCKSRGLTKKQTKHRR